MKYDDLEHLEQKQITPKLLKRLLCYIYPYKTLVTKNIIFNILTTITAVMGPHIIKICIDKYISNSDVSGVMYMSLLFLGVTLLNWIFSVYQTRTTINLGQYVINDIRMELFKHVQILSMAFFDRTKQGRIIARLDNDITTMEWCLTWGIGVLINSVLTLFGAIYFMSKYDWRLCVIVGIILPPIIIATNIFRIKGMQNYRRVQESASRLIANFAETVSGIRIIQSFAREEENLTEYEQINLSHVSNTVGAAKVWSTYFPFLGLMAGIGVAITFLSGYKLVINNELKIGELSAYILYIGMFFGPIYMMSELYNSLLSTSAAAEKIFNLLDTKPEIKDVPQPIVLPNIKGEVVFQNVFLKYKDSKDSHWILKDINFTAKPGETIALVGQTGAGKTSIVSLIARLYEPQKGKILLDGIDMSKISLKYLHSHMAIVLQENFLFSGTIMSNIKYARPEATDEEVINASKFIGADKFIIKNPDGYNTEVKERGIGLSLGERQLICFTRALISNPNILILDEATSSVDAHTEHILQNALQKLLADRTSFVIAQRLSTVRKASQVLVVKDGMIVERGTHHSLLKQSGVYTQMYKEFMRK
ncbi:MAG: ABC transporter ATP-binding protein [Elusimicrobia bacterium]|nr:ABC transporter ATP-binding protein [Elusimicrobiota bacterium]